MELSGRVTSTDSVGTIRQASDRGYEGSSEGTQ